jgi:CubicO group peptidase (beta-lactamase class C family)
VILYGNRGLAFEPGSQYQYSNYGFVLLGAILKRLPDSATTTLSANTCSTPHDADRFTP